MSPPHHASQSLPAPPCGAPAPHNGTDDDRWFQEEVRVHEPLLRAHIRRKFSHLRDVDDIIQESYLRLFRARLAGKLRSAKGFLFTTARTLSFDLFRHRAVVPMEPLTENTASSVYSNGANAAEAASLNQEVALLLEAMDQLPERCRLILVLRRFHGLSHKEITAQLPISQTVI